MVLITENLGRDAISASSDSMKGAPKYYVVVHGKCPGIYDSWEKVQYNIKGFSGGEYCSKPNKSEAIELFHAKRPDWPKHNIPDFTFHASNRLSPISSSSNSQQQYHGGLSVAKKVSLAASLPDSDSESVFQEERDRRLLQSNNNKNRSTKIRSNSLTPKISDLVAPPSDSSGLGPSFDQHYLSGSAAALDPNNSLNLPSGNDPRFRPEKIVLQQNWLEEPLPRTPASRRGSSRRSSRGFGNLSRSNSVQDCSLSIPSRHQFEFGRNTGGRGDWQSIGVRSPIPMKRQEDLNLPAIPTTASSQGGSPRRAPSIELYPSPQINDEGFSFTVTEDNDSHAENNSANRKDNPESSEARKQRKKKDRKKKKDKSKSRRRRSNSRDPEEEEYRSEKNPSHHRRHHRRSNQEHETTPESLDGDLSDRRSRRKKKDKKNRDRSKS